MMIRLTIDGREVEVKEGTTALEAAKELGIEIPTLCYHEAVKPYGACRLCVVEVSKRKRSRLLTSCTYPVEEGVEVKTSSPKVIRARRMIAELLLARCPNVKRIQDLARQYGIEKPRFRTEDEECILCGLCARVCEQVVGISAINFVNRGTERQITTPFDISSDVCIGCGACAYVCPTGAIRVEDIEGRRILHDEVSLVSATPIHIPFPQAVPKVPVIDVDSCIHFKTDNCGVCERSCEPKAIDYHMEDEYIEVEVGSIILATGFQTFNPLLDSRYGYKRLDNVVTGLEVEIMSNASGPTAGGIFLADGREPKSVAILHCVGSRDEKYHEYCSRVCCMYSLKLAHLIMEKTGARVYEFYNDLRCFGKGYEEFYNRMLEEGVNFVRGLAAEVTDAAETPEEEGKLIVQCEDIAIGRQRRIPVDMVVLATGFEPRADADEVARLFSISRSRDGFFLEKHPKLDPVATMTDGVFIAGCCQGPKDIPDTVAQASAAAARALAMISKGRVEAEAATAVVNEDICSGCRICNELCPYSAIEYDPEKKLSHILDILCKGCGTCAAACPAEAILSRHFTTQQIMAQIEGVLV
jgi:heterodisulfide reductase subunit A